MSETKPKRPPKRYPNRELILFDIERHKNEIWFMHRRIEVNEEKVRAFKEWQEKNPPGPKPSDFWRGRFHEMRAASVLAHEVIEKSKRAAARHSRMLDELKQKLAVIDTLPMSFLTDQSVV